VCNFKLIGSDRRSERIIIDKIYQFITNFISNAQFTLNLSIENDIDILQKKKENKKNYSFCLQTTIE